MSYIVITTGWQSYAVPFNAKLVDALATIQATAIPVESFYRDGNPLRFVARPGGKRIEIAVVGDAEVGPEPQEEEVAAA